MYTLQCHRPLTLVNTGAVHADPNAIIALTTALQERAMAIADAAAAVSQLQVALGAAPGQNGDLEAVSAEIELKHGLWTGQKCWEQETEGWINAQFTKLDVAEMDMQVRGGVLLGTSSYVCCVPFSCTFAHFSTSTFVQTMRNLNACL